MGDLGLGPMFMIASPRDFVWGAIFGIAMVAITLGGAIWSLRRK